MKRRLEISRETDQLIVLRRPAKTVTVQCELCGEETKFVRPEEAALISGKSLRQLVRETDDNTLHYQETPEGMLWICLNSLVRLARQGSSKTSTIQPRRKRQ